MVIPTDESRILLRYVVGVDHLGDRLCRGGHSLSHKKRQRDRICYLYSR